MVLGVHDTGVGIEASDLNRIFEPFYTRKKMGNSGSGLGLAVVFGVIKDHNGCIDIKTEVGKGTEFDIYFPMSRKTAYEQEATVNNLHGNESLLIVDDLKDQRKVLTKMLTQLGYRVKSASSSQSAIAYLTKNRADLVILDMIMNEDLDGLDIYSKILEARPGQKAVIVSGYSETDRVREALHLGAGAFLRKPYTLEQIGEVVRKVLDESEK